MTLLFILFERQILRSVEKNWNNQLKGTTYIERLVRGKPGLDFSGKIAGVT